MSVIPGATVGSGTAAAGGLLPGSPEYFLSLTGNGAALSQASAQTLNRTASKASKQQATVAGANSILPLIYGTRRVGAKIGPVLTYSGNLIIRAQWCIGEVDSIVSTEINDAELPAGVTATHYTGTATQGVDPTLVAAYTDKGIVYAKTFPGVCYSVFSIPARKHAGFPRLNATIRGLKIRSTSGGARAYSDNPAYILADFIESTSYGMGRLVDWTTVATLAAACDTLVGGEKKRILSLPLDSAQECRQWLDTLRDYAGCWAVPEGTLYRLIPDVTGSSVMSFNETNIIGAPRLVKRGMRSTPTVVEIVYTDTSASPWIDRKLPPVYAPGVLAGTTPRRFTSIPKPGITRYSEAYRYAVERVNAYTLNDLSISFLAFDEGVKVQVGDIVDITWSAKGLSAKLFRVMKVDSPRPGRWQITADEYDPGKYSSVVVAGPTFPDTTLDDPGNPPTPTGLAVVEEVYSVQTGLYASRLRITWTEPVYSALASYQVVITQGGIRQEIGATPKGTTEFVTGPLKENLLYAVSVAVVSTAGIASATPASATITNNGKTALPSDVPSITAIVLGAESRFSWIPATDVDLTAHELRYSTTGGSWATATLIDRIAAPARTYTTKALPPGTWRVWIKGLDSVRTDVYPYGQESVNPASVDVTVTADPTASVTGTASFSTPTLTNMIATVGGWTTNFAQTWGTLFGGAAMSTFTNALATYHTAGTSTLVTEKYDALTSATRYWTITPRYIDIGGAGVTVTLSLSDDDVTYTPQVGLSVQATARYAKVTYSTTGTMFVYSP